MIVLILALLAMIIASVAQGSKTYNPFGIGDMKGSKPASAGASKPQALVLDSIKHFHNGDEIVRAIEQSFEGFTLSSHLDVVIVSDLVESTTVKEIQNLVTSLSKRLADASPFRFAREKLVFHVNRDATILSQISKLYSGSRLASASASAVKSEGADQADFIKAECAVPRTSMESILSDHFTLASSMTTLYVIMVGDALKKFDVSYTTSLGFKDSSSGSSSSNSNSNSCRRKAFISDSKGFAWIDVFARDDNLVFIDSLREYDNLDFKSSFSKLLSTEDSSSKWIYHISNIILQSSEYLISYPSRGLSHNSGIYNSSATNRIDILIITLCEDESCDHDEHAYGAAESVMKAYTIPNGISATGRNNGLDFSISRVKFSLAEHPSLMVAWMQSVSFPKSSIPDSIRYNQPNVFKNTVEKRIHSNVLLSTLMESKLFVDTIIKHLPLDVNWRASTLLPVISVITSASSNSFTGDAGGGKGTVAIDTDQFHWNNVVTIRDMKWKYKVNSAIFDSESASMGKPKSDDFAKNSNNLPDTAIIVAYSKAYDNINGHCNSSIMCDGVAIPFASEMLPELIFYGIRSAIVGEESLLSHYSKINRRYTIDTTWFTPAMSQANTAVNDQTSNWVDGLPLLVNVPREEISAEMNAGETVSKSSIKTTAKATSENVFDILNLQSLVPNAASDAVSKNIYEGFVSFVREASLEYSHLEYSTVMNTLRSLDGQIDELDVKVNKILSRKGSIVCEK